MKIKFIYHHLRHCAHVNDNVSFFFLRIQLHKQILTRLENEILPRKEIELFDVESFCEL